MYRKAIKETTSLEVNTSYEGESIEEKVNRIVNNKEPITDGAPLIYTDRKDGVLAETNPRTDRFEVAVEAMDKVAKAQIAKREARLNPIKGGKGEAGQEPGDKGGDKPGGETGGQSLEGTK